MTKRARVSDVSAGELEKIAPVTVARFATCGLDRRPHCVPVCFVVSEGRLYVPLDEKPKLVEPRRLRRVRNLIENPHVSLTVDHYEDDWNKLWFVMIEGEATLVALEPDVRALLNEKYAQYHSMKIHQAIRIEPTHAVSWPHEPTS